jgi:hypothetical protein
MFLSIPIGGNMREAVGKDLSADIRRLLGLVKGMESISPDLWKRIGELRVKHKWPSWCFVPSDQLARLLGRLNIPPREGAGTRLYALTALCSWRLTRGLYSFDPDLLAAVCQTSIDEDLPTSPLLQLPEWCVYVLPPGILFEGVDLRGFFAHLDCDPSGSPELRLLLDFGDGRLSFTLPLDLSHSTLSSSLKASRDRMVQMLGSLAESPGIESIARDDLSDYSSRIAPLVSLVLYLCSDNADIRSRADESTVPKQPSPKRTRKGVRFFPAEQPTEWDVGYRIGEALRRLRTVSTTTQPDGGEIQSRHISPHIRRAHWHTYWVGPLRDIGERRVTVKWIPPIAVNVSVDLPKPVVRRVKDPLFKDGGKK